MADDLDLNSLFSSDLFYDPFSTLLSSPCEVGDGFCDNASLFNTNSNIETRSPRGVPESVTFSCAPLRAEKRPFASEGDPLAEDFEEFLVPGFGAGSCVTPVAPVDLCALLGGDTLTGDKRVRPVSGSSMRRDVSMERLPKRRKVGNGPSVSVLPPVNDLLMGGGAPLQLLIPPTTSGRQQQQQQQAPTPLPLDAVVPSLTQLPTPFPVQGGPLSPLSFVPPREKAIEAISSDLSLPIPVPLPVPVPDAPPSVPDDGLSVPIPVPIPVPVPVAAPVRLRPPAVAVALSLPPVAPVDHMDPMAPAPTSGWTVVSTGSSSSCSSSSGCACSSRIRLKWSKEDHGESIPTELYKSTVYSMSHELLVPRSMRMPMRMRMRMGLVGPVVATVQVVSDRNKTQILVDGEPPLTQHSVTLQRSSESGSESELDGSDSDSDSDFDVWSGIVAFQLTDCSYHHNMDAFRFVVTYAVPSASASSAASVPILKVWSAPFVCKARRGSQSQRKRRRRKAKTAKRAKRAQRAQRTKGVAVWSRFCDNVESLVGCASGLPQTRRPEAGEMIFQRLRALGGFGV